jgi:hypothetical protein
MVSHVRQMETQAFAERLRSALVDAGVGVSPTTVAHEFNLRYWGKSITVHAARNWLMGQSLPAQDKLVVLAQWLQVSPHELRFGASAGHEVRSTDPLTGQLNLRDREMLGRYLALAPQDKSTVCEVVAALSRSPSVPKGERA